MVLAEFTVEEILDKIQFRSTTYLRKNERVILCGYPVKISTLKLQTFKKSIVCARCGRKGNVFKLETRAGENPHLNLYHSTIEAGEILMTRDHIIPLCRNGPDNLANLQTMCSPCNTMKADRIQKWYFTADTYRLINTWNLDLGGDY